MDHPGAAFLADVFGPSTNDPVFVCSLLNADVRGSEPINERFVTTRQTDEISGFANKWDRPGRATYFCVSTVRPTARRRSKETLSELNCLHSDIDFKDTIEPPEEIRRIVGQLMLPPSKVNATGHGLHLYWLFKEGIEATQANIADVERLLRLLCNHLGGDPAAAEAARLLRLPGSHNSKYGEWVEVTTEIDRNLRYTLDELADWLELVSPVIHRREPKGSGRDTNPWLEVAARFGFKPPVDVLQRLTAMQFHGPGDSAIHLTQLAVSAALLNRGRPIDEVVNVLLEATRAAAGELERDWNWKREERTIREMCTSWLAKHPAPTMSRTPTPGTANTPTDPLPPREPDAEIGPAPAAAPTASSSRLPIIALKPGELPRIMREAEQALAGFPIFARAGSLVYPISESVPAADDRTTLTAKLKTISSDLLLVWLAQAATFLKFNKRSNSWVRTDPPPRLATSLLAVESDWPYPRVVGVATNPVLRPDGSLLTATGYDPTTQLYLMPDASLSALRVPERPTYAQASAALANLVDLLSGFTFADPVDRAVALSLILTVVARSSMSVAPLHLIRAHTAGTGKSHLADTAAVISSGRLCPVITFGKTPEEAEKRLGALLRESVPMISLDNLSSDLEGDLLCQLAERPAVRIRILGLSEAPEYECRSALIATGNNVGPRGDMVRRTLICNLDADVERPELRRFDFDPVARVLADRALYLGAGYTIIRAYQMAGAPAVCDPLGSYGKWTSMVRAPLIWLDEADPVNSMEVARDEDPDLASLRELFAQWQLHLAAQGSLTALQIKETACEQDTDRKPIRPEFNDLLIRIAGDRGTVSTNRLGRWLHRNEGRVVEGRRLTSTKTSDTKARRYYLRN
jgi:putative DNA primase/helicase